MESEKSASGTCRAGEGTLDLYLEVQNHFYNKNYTTTGKLLRV
jgi:hypothetical protein